jgi:hypothetical protein
VSAGPARAGRSRRAPCRPEEGLRLGRRHPHPRPQGLRRQGAARRPVAQGLQAHRGTAHGSGGRHRGRRQGPPGGRRQGLAEEEPGDRRQARPGRRDPLADEPDRRRRAGSPGPAGRPSVRDRPSRAERAGRSRTGVRERSGQPLRGARPDRARTQLPVPALVRDPASTTVRWTARTGDGPWRRDHAARPAGRPERLPHWREL